MRSGLVVLDDGEVVDTGDRAPNVLDLLIMGIAVLVVAETVGRGVHDLDRVELRHVDGILLAHQGFAFWKRKLIDWMCAPVASATRRKTSARDTPWWRA
jgi:hypothetical protein